MANKGGGFDLFGGLFDFNGDGKTDIFEEALAFKIFEESFKKNEHSDDIGMILPDTHAWRDHCEDGVEFGVDPEDYETEEEYSEALEEAKYAWRESCEDGYEFDVNPEDYETEEEYNEALEEARTAWRDTCDDGSDVDIDPYDYDTEEEYNEALEEAREEASTISIPVSIKFTRPGQETLDAIKRSDYPNERKYYAAYHLCDVKQGTAISFGDGSEQSEVERCEFILYSESTAANYLTVFDGFLYAQAVKENFKLPFSIPDEDDEVITHFDDLFMEIAEEDVQLAVDVWRWCIKIFGPYRKYMKYSWELYNRIISSTDEYPKEFLDLAVKTIGTDNAFCDGLLAQNPEFPYSIAPYIVRALELGLTDEARTIFSAAINNPVGKSKEKEELVDSIISDCSDWEELETMESFKLTIIPVLKEMTDKRIQRLLPQFIEKVDEYIDEVERTSEKYIYSRRYSWRKNCVDGSKYGVDPLDYETEDEYNKAINEEKYAWRRWHSYDAKKYRIDPSAYDDEDSFMAALDAERDLRKRQNDAEKRPYMNTDPLTDTDKSVYVFCGVTFNGGDKLYYYRTDDETIAIGDRVIVPVGMDGKEAVAEIATFEKHRRKTAPYPVEKASFIKGRYSAEE